MKGAGRVLFIGGPNDGYRKPWPSCTNGPATQLQLQAAVMRQTGSWPPTPTQAMQQTIGYTTHVYRLVKHGAMMIAVDSTITDITAQLVRGYHYHRNRR